MGFFQRLGWPMLFAISLSTEFSAALPYGAPAQAPLGPAISHYDFDVTVGQRAPDCFREGLHQRSWAICWQSNSLSGCMSERNIRRVPFLLLKTALLVAEKDVILVNGEYHKQIEVTQGNMLEVSW